MLLLFGVALVAACGGGSEKAASPTATKSTAAPTASKAAATAEAKSGGATVTVTDMLQRRVEVPARPQRIVALSPTGVELVYALGGQVVGRTRTAVFPAAATQAADVGTAYQPNLEAILALNPDLVIADSVIHAQPALRSTVEGIRTPVLFVGADNYKDVQASIRLMGQVLSAGERADALVREIEGKRTAAAQAVTAAGNPTAVAMIADRDQTLYAAKGTSYAGDLLQQVGLKNPASDLPDSGPFPGYTAVAPDILLRFNPAYIFAITPAPEPAPRLSTLIPQIPPFRGLAAVQQNHVVESNVDMFLQAPGPRAGEAFDFIAKTVSGAR